MSTQSLIKHKSDGMTLIEIIFAIAILGTVITITYAASLNAWRNAQSANQRTQAQYAAQDQIERLRSSRNDANFYWETQPSPTNIQGFVDKIRSLGSADFAMEKCDGTELQACTFKPINPAGLAYKVAATKMSDTDGTDFFISVKPTEMYVKTGPTATETPQTYDSLTSPSQIQAIKFEVTVTWAPATGGPTGILRAVTILTRKDVGQ